MITIVLAVSRADYLERVITRIELLECNPEDINIVCVVDGPSALYVRARNLVNGLKFKERLTVQLDLKTTSPLINIKERRQRIAAIHNQAKGLIRDSDGYVFSVEDDTLISRGSLKKLLLFASTRSAFGMGVGVELGRWGAPYVGAWRADDIYNPNKLVSIENIYPVPLGQTPSSIDACGLYCTLIKTNIYKNHEFTSKNGLGPDINLGIDARQQGFENFILWDVQCTHLFKKGKQEAKITPADPSLVVTLTKKSDISWLVSY